VPRDFPPDLARLIVLMLADSEKHLSGLNGITPRLPGLAEYREQLRTAAASVNGRPFVMVNSSAAGAGWLTAGEAALVMGVSPRQVRRLARDGQIIAQQHGRAWWIDRFAAEDYRRRRL
jgi:excisionase family DNA binding protein